MSLRSVVRGLTRWSAWMVGLLPLVVGAQQPPPNIMFLLDNSEAMQEFPTFLPEDFTPGYYPNPPSPRPGDRGGDGPAGHFINTGCTDPKLVQAMGWFDKNSTDPWMNGSIPFDPEGQGYQRFFEASRFYHARGRRLGWMTREAPYALHSDFRGLESESNPLYACWQVLDWNELYQNSDVLNECVSCLETKGWWRGPRVSAKTVGSMNSPWRQPHEPPLPAEALRKWVVKGGALNLRPPKFVIARKVLKDIITSTTGARLGLATLGSRSSVETASFKAPLIVSDMSPSCAQSLPTFDETALNRSQMKTTLNELRFGNDSRPLGEALFGLGGYFSSQRADNQWADWFSQPLVPGALGWPGCCDGGTPPRDSSGAAVPWGAATDEWLPPHRYVNGEFVWGQPWERLDSGSICAANQPNAVIVVTAGVPFNDNTVPITRMMDLLVRSGARHGDGSPLTFDPSSPATNLHSGGVNYCDQFLSDFWTPYTKDVCDYTDWNWPTGLARTNKNFMDDVAFFLSHADLRGDLPGGQKLRTSIIHMGSWPSTGTHPILGSMAIAGEGKRYLRYDAEGLRESLVEVIQHSRTRLPEVSARVPDNVMFLVDTHASMQDYPEPLPEVFTPGHEPAPSHPAPGEPGGDGPAGHFLHTGCTDPALVEAMRWYDPDSASPRENGTIPHDEDEGLASRFFEADKFYHSRGRRLAWQPEESPSSLSADFKRLSPESTARDACLRVMDGDAAYAGSPVLQQCLKCLESRGWWRGPLVSEKTLGRMNSPTRQAHEPPLPREALRKWVVKGGVLNLRPPRFVIARKVLRDLVASTTGTRVGVATFGRDPGSYDPPVLLSGPALRPSCDVATGGALSEADQTALRRAVNGLSFAHADRSTGEALFGLGGYFSSQRRDARWEGWFKQPIAPGHFGWPGCCDGGTFDSPYGGEQGQGWGTASDEWLKPPRILQGTYLPGQPWESVTTAERHYCAAEQTSRVVVLTGGRPVQDNTVPITRMMQLLIQRGARHPDGAPLTFDARDPAHNPSAGGVNYCDAFGVAKGDCDYTEYNWPTGLASGNKNFMDDVTFFLANMDLRGDLPGVQSLRTSIVNFAGPDEPMLHSMARAGNGLSLRAQSAEQLRAALQAAMSSRRPDLRPATQDRPLP
ncbi:hypothetical protein [Melittangium boletus]|uniref:hypothetical protein n=1 Tax=Melittangium boletus TaxID=83453 RepID=UPI003DA26838